MNTRREPPKGAMEKMGERVRQRALTGTEASTVGFVLVATIGAGAGLGYWLDTIFKTSWIVAVGVLGGAALGFFEMIQVANRLTRKSQAADEEKSRREIKQAIEAPRPQPRDVIERESEPQEVERERFFKIPPPPLPGTGSPPKDDDENQIP